MVDLDKKYFIKDGKEYIVRFFECDDKRDLRDLILINESPGVQRWMENVHGLNIWNYRNWMDEKGNGNTFLFAIADPREESTSDHRVHGFVYFYPSKIMSGKLEISYAKRPGAPSGLTAIAIEIACKLVLDYLKEKKPWLVSGMKVLAEIEKGNDASIKVAEKVGFRKIRDFDEKNNGLWERELEKIVQLETEHQRPLEHLRRFRQLNDSFCGPATLQILLSHFGIEADQEKLVLSATTMEHGLKIGMSKELLAKAVKNSYPQMSFWVKNNAELSDIETMVRVHNYPVGVDWQGIFYDEGDENYPRYSVMADENEKRVRGDSGHYCVITDVDKTNDRIRMIDPYGEYSHKDRFFRISEFLNRWWDDRMDKNIDGSNKYVFEKRLMFVVVPKNVRIPESLGMFEL